MEARHLLKQLKDDDWYLGDTEGACRQYIHPEKPGVITVCVRFSDELGPETLVRATAAAESAGETAASDVAIEVESTSTGVSAYAPELSGCVATGADEADVRQRMTGALALHRRGIEGATR